MQRQICDLVRVLDAFPCGQSFGQGILALGQYLFGCLGLAWVRVLKSRRGGRAGHEAVHINVARPKFIGEPISHHVQRSLGHMICAAVRPRRIALARGQIDDLAALVHAAQKVSRDQVWTAQIDLHHLPPQIGVRGFERPAFQIGARVVHDDIDRSEPGQNAFAKGFGLGRIPKIDGRSKTLLAKPRNLRLYGIQLSL